jgi:hypothetical protein
MHSEDRGPGIRIHRDNYRFPCFSLQEPMCVWTQDGWWTLPDPLAAPPRGPAIDVFFNLGGGRRWTRRQSHLGARH